MTSNDNDLIIRYQKALESFIKKIEKDPYIEALYVYGSMAKGNIWEKSDIDIIIVGRDEKYAPFAWFTLVQDDIIFNALVFNRSQFKSNHEKGHTKDWTFMFYQSKLLYSKDCIYKEYLEQAQSLGENDKKNTLLNISDRIIIQMQKAGKLLRYHTDSSRCFLLISRILIDFAELIVVLEGKIPLEYPVNQAIEIDIEFYGKMFNQLINHPSDWEVFKNILTDLDNFFDVNKKILFESLIDYLINAEEDISMSKLAYHINKKQWAHEFFLLETLEWLTEKGVVERFEKPVILGKGSKLFMNEISYYYHAGK